MHNPNHIYPLIIIGSGPAAYTASIYAGRAKIEHLIITGELKGGQLVTSLDVENFPGFPLISGYDLMTTLENHATSFGGMAINDYINQVDFTKSPFTLTGNKRSYLCKSVIIATGSSPKYLGLKNEEYLLGRGVSYCATCDGNFFKNQEVAVIGGGNTAAEDALYLANIVNKVYLVHRKDTLRAEKILQEKIFKHPKIEVIWHSKVTELLSAQQGLTAIKLANLLDNSCRTLNVTGVFIAIGHTPNTAFLGKSLTLDDSGYIVTANKSSHTSVKGVFAAGDVQDPTYRQAITSAGSGCVSAIDVNMFLINHS